jgi:hypothetical protein
VEGTIQCNFLIYDPYEDLWNYTYEARIIGPSNSQVQYKTGWDYQKVSLGGTTSVTLTDPDEGNYTCKVNWVADSYPLPEEQRTTTVTYRIPTGETTIRNAWSGATNFATAFKFRAQLTGSGSFSGRRVTENDGGNGLDTCKNQDPTGSIPMSERITGGYWDINSANTYNDDDTVGWSETAVIYYRGRGVTTCQTQFDQYMTINPSKGYKTNTLMMGFTATTVWSERDGVRETKGY